ncbi:uncharacterized protein LOC144088906 isoform X2 [Stigmatopora argus]
MQADDDDDDAAGGQILTDLREELADWSQEQLGQMHVDTAFVMPDALDNVEEEQEEKNGVQPNDRRRLDVDVDEGDWQNNVTMRFFDGRRECLPTPPPLHRLDVYRQQPVENDWDCRLRFVASVTQTYFGPIKVFGWLA